MRNLLVLSIVTICCSNAVFAQNGTPIQPISVAPQITSPVTPPLGSSISISDNSKPINTPAATDGANYDVEVVSSLDEYKNRKKLIRERAQTLKLERQRVALEQYNRAMYEQSLKMAEEKKKSKANGTPEKKSMTIQEFYSRNSRIFAGSKE